MGPGPDEITVYANGVPAAVLGRHTNTRDLESEDPMLRARVYDFQALYWTRSGALQRLQGVHALDILGPAITLLRGQHRPIYHPRPGLETPRVVLPTHNPLGLRPIDVFQIAMKLGF